MKKYTGLLSLMMLCVSSTSAYNVKPPRLTVIIVVDQFAHHYIDKLYPYLKYGLRYLIDHGVFYTNAYCNNGQPGTCTGHAGLNTGVPANYHGFVSNTWYENGKKVACDDDDSDGARVLSPDGVYEYGKSAHRLMADGLTDQCVLQTQPNSTFTSYSISMKSRSAIATASKLGKPLWFDCNTGMFTSSKAYFDKLPQWVELFNNEHNVSNRGSIIWEPMYPRSPYAYRFFNVDNYTRTRSKETLIGKELAVPDDANPDNPFYFFEKSPQANQLILDCSLECIKQHVSRKHRNRLLLWVCLSPLDKIGHQYGNTSMEAIDMIYHLDKQLQRFMRKTLRVIGKHELIFVLTADHGVMPLPELLQDEGFTLPHRIDRLTWVKKINDVINEKHGIENIVLNYKGQELVLDQVALEKLDPVKQAAIIADIKLCALKEPGIKNAWTYDELIHMPTQPGSLEDNIKKQLFRGRSGYIVIEPYPYTIITHWPEGASHKTPYSYDTHIPLIVFHPGKFEKQYVRQRVSSLQLPNTLAEVLNIPKPSASTCEILPELFDPTYK